MVHQANGFTAFTAFSIDFEAIVSSWGQGGCWRRCSTGTSYNRDINLACPLYLILLDFDEGHVRSFKGRVMSLNYVLGKDKYELSKETDLYVRNMVAGIVALANWPPIYTSLPQL